MAEKARAKKTLAQEVTILGGFIAGSLAACGAVTFTNPIELIKTRMQLQGELSVKDTAPRIYKNPVQAALVISRNEGFRGLQQGLVGGYVYQIGLNGCKLGLYEPTRHYLTEALLLGQFPEDASHIPQNLFINVLAGVIAGLAGAAVSNPFFLVKTRMQSYNKATTGIHIGQQTYYRGLWDGLRTIYRTEGMKGWFRGTNAALLRTGVGSAAQLPVYNLTKNYLLDRNLMAHGAVGLHLGSSAMAGLGVSIVMNPWDVVLTRLYNQKGNLYKGPIDCFAKTIITEGPAALYKGFWAQLFRVVPHSILMLLFMEHSMKLVHTVENRLA